MYMQERQQNEKNPRRESRVLKYLERTKAGFICLLDIVTSLGEHGKLRGIAVI